MRRVWNAVKGDMLFQFRSGFHTIYVVLSLIYIIALNEMPEDWARIGAPFMIFSDPSMLGFFFMGGLVMLEKGQGIVDLIAVTPTRIHEYLVGKVISLTLISLLAGFAIALFTGQAFNPVQLFLSVAVTSAMYSLLGFLVAMNSGTVNQYFGKAVPMMLVIVLPLFTLTGFPYSWFFYALPSVATAKLFLIAFYGGPGWTFLACLMISLIWFLTLGRWSVKAFEAYSRGGEQG